MKQLFRAKWWVINSNWNVDMKMLVIVTLAIGNSHRRGSPAIEYQELSKFEMERMRLTQSLVHHRMPNPFTAASWANWKKKKNVEQKPTHLFTEALKTQFIKLIVCTPSHSFACESFIWMKRPTQKTIDIPVAFKDFVKSSYHSTCSLSLPLSLSLSLSLFRSVCLLFFVCAKRN